MNSRLLELIYAERDRDSKGISRSNYTELGGWHSHNDLHKVAGYGDLVDLIGTACDRLSEDQGYDSRYRLRIGTMWSIINPPGSSNRAHVHPGCMWSGVYYIHTPEHCGQIEFIEPRTAQLMNQPRYSPNAKRAKENWLKVRYDPKPGRMIIFPSWLYHAVDPNMSKNEGKDGDRVIVSFNLNQNKG